MPTLAIQKKRVAAYARVSTNSEEQLTSYEAQVKHYTEYIQSKEYTDHGSLFLCIRIRELLGPAHPNARDSTV